MAVRSVILLFLIVGWQVLLSQADNYVNSIDEKEKHSISTYLQKRYWSKAKSKIVYEQALSELQQDASAVILQKEILKEFFRNSRNFLRSVNAEHTVIKILDKKGLEENSIFLFEEINSDHAISFSGLKIIKPNGTEQIVEIDKKAVLIKSGKLTKKRLVIPNLEIGDIIDYYSYLEFRVLFPEQYSRTYDPIYIIPQNVYPILDYNLTFSLGPSAFLNVSKHELPAFEKTTFKVNKRTFTRCSLSLQNLEQYPKDLKWFYPFQGIPNLKFQVFIGPYYGNTDVKYNLGGTQKMNTSIQMSKLQDYLFEIIDGNNEKSFYKSFKGALKKKDLNVKKMDKQKLTEALFLFYRHKYGEKINVDQASYQFARKLHFVLDKLEIKHDIVIGLNREVSAVEDFILTDEIKLLLKVDIGKPVYLATPNQYSIMGELPHNLENTIGYLYNPATRSLSSEVLPSSTYLENSIKETWDISFKHLNKEVTVSRATKVSGNEKLHYQAMLESNIYDKTVDEYLILKEIEDRVGAVDQESYKILQATIGNSGDQPDVYFTDGFTLHNFATTSKHNYLIPIGRFIASENTLDENRSFDVYFDYPSSQQYTINFNIPEGFKLGEIKHLNREVINSVGKFVSTASVSNNRLTIEVSKTFNNYFEHQENWSEIVNIIAALNKFNQQKILLIAN